VHGVYRFRSPAADEAADACRTRALS